MSRIVHNKIGCQNCGDVIESKHVWDFVACSCFKNEEGNQGVCVDGGREYLRRVGDNYVELSESYDENGKRNELPVDW